MALIIDPDDIDQRPTTTNVTDLVVGTPTGNQATITSAGSNLPVMADNSFFVMRNNADPNNNGLWHVDDVGGGSAAAVDADKVSGPLPTAEASDATDIDTDGEYFVDTGNRRIYLLEQGALSVDGVTAQALYSSLKDDWKALADMIPHDFPMVAVTPEQFEFTEDWVPRDDSVEGIQTKKLIRTAGWSEIDAAGVLQKQTLGVITLGTFEDAVNDTAHYQLGDDPTDTTAGVDFTFNGPVNEAIETYNNVTPADTGTGFAITTLNTIARNDGGDWSTDGYVVGGQIEISNAEDVGNNGSWVLTSVGSGVDGSVVVSGTPLTNNAADTTMTAAVDNRNAVKVFLRVRDGDTNGKTYAQQDLAAIGLTVVTNKAERFPLSNITDLKILETDANIAANSPYTQIEVKYFDGTFTHDVGATPRNFGICVDVGTFSGIDGESFTTTSFTTADAGIPATTYDGGQLIIHEGADKGSHLITTATGGTVTLDAALTATAGPGLSFTLQRSSPVVASVQEIYEKVQYLLRQAADIDEAPGPAAVVTGKTADGLAAFVGDTILFGSLIPANPNSPADDGVTVQGFDTNDTNDIRIYDNTGAERQYPFVAAGTITFNTNAQNDTGPAEYTMFFDYTTRTNVTDFVIASAAADVADWTSAGTNLPDMAVGDYVRLVGATNAENNGIWIVTVETTPSAAYTMRKVDGQTVVEEGSAVRDVDENPIDSPDAIIVNDNGGTPIDATVPGPSASFDFDYTNNVQGGRAAASDAAIVIRLAGTDLAQNVETFGTIVQATGQAFAVVAGLERNYLV